MGPMLPGGFQAEQVHATRQVGSLEFYRMCSGYLAGIRQHADTGPEHIVDPQPHRPGFSKRKTDGRYRVKGVWTRPVQRSVL